MANIFSAEVARTLADIAQTKLNIARDRALLAADPTNQRLRTQIASGQAYLIDLDAQLAFFQQTETAPTASSGQVISEEARARTERSITSNPSPPPGVLAPDGRINPLDVETGTNSTVRSQEQTQSTPPAGEGSALPYNTADTDPNVNTSSSIFAFGDDQGFALPPTPSLQAGVAANRDDNTAPNTNNTAQLINANFNQRIVPEPNVLDEYASYTYAITWYLLTPDQYNEMTKSQKKNCASWQLLMQSGGAPTQAAGITSNSTATAGRNQYFSLDYYIDDLEIESLVPLKGTGAANTATNIKFRVTEPNGITLIENLYKAVSTLYQQKNVNKAANYPMAQYCLAVRFYGYNAAGELVTTGRRGTNGTTNLTDPKAIVEKFYPFVITNIRFRIPKDRVVEYDIEAKPIPHFYNKSQDRGTIPFSFELIGETVDQVLRGKPIGTVYPSSPGERRDSPQPGISAPTQPADTPAGTGIITPEDIVSFDITSGITE